MKRAAWILIILVTLVVLYGFKQYNEKQNIQVSLKSEMMKKENKKPLPSHFKEKLKKEMTLTQIEDVLGPYQEVYGSGVSWLVWYFDDDFCLVIFYTGQKNDSKKKWFWYKCKPGEFNLNVLKAKMKEGKEANSNEDK